MKITDVKIRMLTAYAPDTGVKFDPSRVSYMRSIPLDMVDSKPVIDNVAGGKAVDPNARRTTTGAFIEIETDEGVVGRCGPIIYSNLIIPIIKQDYTEMLIGQDPMNNELIWQRMYRKNPHAYAANHAIAMGVIDIAIWDIKCKKAGLPLYQMLGGAVQTELPAYANTIFCAYDPVKNDYDLDKVAEVIDGLVKEGFAGTKWYPHSNPKEGKKGIENTYQLVKTIRETAGPDFKIMLDCWSSWDVDFTIRAARRMEELDLEWIEEPIMPTDLEGYTEISRKSPVNISCGENLYMRNMYKPFLDRNAAQIFQPDITWTSGITEGVKIIHLIESYSKMVAIHTASLPVSIQIAAGYNRGFMPIQEFLVNLSPTSQVYLKDKMLPVGGKYHLFDTPGCGYELDMDAIIDDYYL